MNFYFFLRNPQSIGLTKGYAIAPRPISDYWTLSSTPQRCINEAAHLLAAGIINVTTDFIVVLVPIRTMLSLQLPLPQRIVISILFTTGLLATAAGAIRTYYISIMTTNADHDVTWHANTAFLTGVVELFVGIVSLALRENTTYGSRRLDLQEDYC